MAISESNLTAKEFSKKIEAKASSAQVEKYKRYFKDATTQGDKFIGVGMGPVFQLAKEYMNMSIPEIEKLLANPIHEIRAGGVSIMDFQARKKKTPKEQRKALFDLYLRRHDRINNWDLVDRSAIYVVGGYLIDKPKDILYKLAKSKNIWERRTSIIATAYFMKHKETKDTFEIAEILIDDKEDLVHKAVGWMLRVAGGVNIKELYKFLDKHAATMPRTMLRYSLEKVEKNRKLHYMNLKNSLSS